MTVAALLGWLVLVPCSLALAGSREADPDSPSPGRAAPRRRLVLSPVALPALSDLLDEEEALELGKRQFDDYGHMRFGKRGDPEDKFDDYGHMRFGRGRLR